jgi:CBS domain-containing protein
VSAYPRSLLCLPLALVFAAGCGGGGSDRVEVAAPATADAASASCLALHEALPAKVMDGARRKVSTESASTAAWGDPAIVLRCGVERPPSLRVVDPDKVGSEPVDSVEVNGVVWAFAKFDGGVRFTTVYRRVRVEMTVPKKFAEPAAPLVDVADAVTRTNPTTLDLNA